MSDEDRVESNGTANGLGHAAYVPKKPSPSMISNQLRDELIRILKTGDAKNEGAFTVAIAAQVEKFVIAAREILMTESLAQNDLGSLMMMRKHHQGWNSVIGGGGYYSSGSLSLGNDSPMPLPIVNNENFGVQAVRQIVEAVRTMGDSPAKIVEALAVARSNNLTDVVAVLEKKLGVAKADEAPPQGASGPEIGALQ